MTKFWYLLGNFAALCTLLGVSLSNLLQSDRLVWLSLALIGASLGFIVWRVYLVSKHILQRNYPSGYSPIATYASFATKDGDNYVYEVFRHIQIKNPWLKSLKHHFFWTGSKDPNINTKTHNCSPITKHVNEQGLELSEVILSFDKARFYNEPEIVHIAMNLDDSDNSAEPFLVQKVDHPIQLLHFRVELQHAPNSYQTSSAKLMRRKCDLPQADFNEVIDVVPFDAISKSYSYYLVSPEPGYHYKLEWHKPPQKRRSNKRTKKTTPTSKSAATTQAA